MAESKILNVVKENMDRLSLTKPRDSISKHITDEQQAQKERYDKIRKDARKILHRGTSIKYE